MFAFFFMKFINVQHVWDELSQTEMYCNGILLHADENLYLIFYSLTGSAMFNYDEPS